MGGTLINRLPGTDYKFAPPEDERLCQWIATHRRGNGFAGDLANLPALFEIYRRSKTGRTFVITVNGEIRAVALCRLVEKLQHAAHLYFGSKTGCYLAIDEMVALDAQARRQFVAQAREAYPHVHAWVFQRGNRSVVIGPRHIRLLERI